MKVIREGHRYELDMFEDTPDDKGNQVIQFIEKAPVEEGSAVLTTLYNGTTNEEVISVLVDRLEYLDNNWPCTENKMAIFHLKAALAALEYRTQSRLARGVEGQNKA